MSYVFDIKRYAINDGPGIRITIFLKGCPLRCVWCHNPEGLKPTQDKLYTKRKCIGCQFCVQACPQGALKLTAEEGIVTDYSKCVMCGKCADACPSTAMEMAGKNYSVDYLMKEIEKEATTIATSGGGVTVCGGEPLMHADFLLEILKRCKDEGIHRCVDTTLFASEVVVKRVAEYTSLFLVDLKHMDSDIHKFYTAVPNERILSNIKMISEMGCNFWIRIPLIVGVNADIENLERSADFLASLPKQPEIVNLLVYHDIGKGKHDRLGTSYNPEKYSFEAPSEELQQQALEIFKARGLKVKIGG